MTGATDLVRLDAASSKEIGLEWRFVRERVVPALVAAGIGRKIGRYLYARRETVIAFLAGEFDGQRGRRPGGVR